jgi:RimJ/RimL family protein N-acetyltransferase
MTEHVTELLTARLRLRQWRPGDRAPFAILTSDPDVMRYFPSTLTRQESDELADIFERMVARLGWGMWAVEERATGDFIGFTGIAPPRYDVAFMQAPEIGWRLLRAAWGRGFATEGAHAAAKFAFEELGLQEVLAVAVAENERSLAVMERIGMRRDQRYDLDYPLVGDDGTNKRVLYRLARGWLRPALGPSTRSRPISGSASPT